MHAHRGRMDEVNRLRSQAHALKQVGHDESELPVRMLLRTRPSGWANCWNPNCTTETSPAR